MNNEKRKIAKERKMKIYKNIEELIEMAKNTNEQLDLACHIELEIDDKKHLSYNVFVNTRELLFLCEDCTVEYDVNTFGDRDSLLLFNVNYDN